ncbi:MAG: 1-acyl-sn-glycerol-3-phosphate acyltransferase [Pelagibacteraceae bacterium]|nr:1-acyl-sn-glycerol-3-phosphate acyltransferase [Pelagibacteraceae bacterium]
MKYKFLLFFYFSSALVLIFSILGIFMSYKKFRFFINLFTKNMTFSLKKICNIDVQVNKNSVNKLENGYLYASKHQSIFETVYFNSLFYNPVYILKKELLNIPLFGTYLKKLGMIAIDRKQGIKSLKLVNYQAAKLIDHRPIVIFPEGTRTSFGDQPDLKPGIYSMYKNLNRPVIPIALNTGKFWPKSNQMNLGNMQIEFKDPIQPGLSKEEFLLKLKLEINSLNH